MTEFELPIGGDIEAGTYLCVLTGWEPFEFPSDGTYSPAGEMVESIKWTFTTDDNNTIEGTSSRMTSPRSKLRAWCLGLGLDVRTVKVLTPDKLIGREALVTVSINDDGFPKVESVVPAPKGKKTND